MKLAGENARAPPEWIKTLTSPERGLVTKNNAFSKYLHGAFYFNSAACTVQPAWFELAEAAHRDTLAPTSSFGPDGTASGSGGGVVGSESRNPTHAARNRRRDGGGSSVCALLCGCGDGREDAERGEGLRGHRGEEKDQEDQVSPLPWHLLGLDPLRRRRRRGKWTIAVRVDASPRTVSQPTNNPTNQPTNQPTNNQFFRTLVAASLYALASRSAALGSSFWLRVLCVVLFALLCVSSS